MKPLVSFSSEMCAIHLTFRIPGLKALSRMRLITPWGTQMRASVNPKGHQRVRLLTPRGTQTSASINPMGHSDACVY